MIERRFTKWAKWLERTSLDGMEFPGVYVCALAGNQFNPSREFEWTSHIIYIGMTNSAGGLRARLKQFDNTIIGKTGHGGADRVRYKHQDYQKLCTDLYVSVASFPCDVKTNQPKDLVVMGEVAKFEYDCFAEFAKSHGRLPEFNDKKNSPKYSLTFGRASADKPLS
jgi:hypothetical protein